ncbi:NAD(P)/FAD-dependent oxidoreductase [Streptomyces sp. NPDC050485]|uniref:NAD(P)/FAD-dependent oxidoreductase n=1 Tax=Streptomyces sp. NPDC050485 TaxID=3365617 RepID=UPI0037AB838C
MPTAIVAGGSIAGLACALALSRTGYRVLVLERAAPPPDGPLARAAARWQRPTVPQGVHSHTLTSLGVRVLRERAPGLLAAARAAGAPILDMTAALPADATDSAREPADDELVALGCRRATLELLLHRHLRALPGVTIRHDTVVAGLELDPDRRRVRAAVTHTGDRIRADLVIDATGRRALSRTWLDDAGIPRTPDRTSPSGLVSHTRHYRLKARELPTPLNRGNSVGGIWDHYAGVLHPGDHHTFAIALGTLPGDRALSALRTPAGFTAAATATPGLAPWLAPEASEPITPVHVITSPPNALYGTASPRQEHPVAGLFPVGDAACVTNPLFGRGMSLALEHAFRLADVLAENPAVDLTQRHAVARMTEGLLLPWYEQSVAGDRILMARWRAARDGRPQPPRTPPDAASPTIEQITAAAQGDGAVWRALTRMLMTLTTPAELLDDDKLRARVHQAPAPCGSPRPPGRDAFVRGVTAAKEKHT